MKECDILAFRTQLQILMVEANLREMEVKVLQMRFGLVNGQAMLLEDVGKELGVTREHVRQIEAKALRKMRAHMHSFGEYDWLVELLPWTLLLRALKG